MKLKVLSGVVFLCGFCLLVNSRLEAQKSPQPSNPEQRPFIAQYLVSRSTDGSVTEPYEYRVKYVNSFGEWKETRYSFDGRAVTWMASKDGLYIVKKDSLQYYGNYDPEMVKYPS